MATALNSELAPIWPLSVARYHAMIDAGILGPDDRVELLEGVIVEKMSKNPPHRISNRRTRLALERAIGSAWYVDEKEPITLATSEPEPDVSVIRGDTADYPDGHPGAENVGMVVEIADTSLERDRVLKKRIYAAAGIPVYWVVDLNAPRVEVLTRPQNGQYTEGAVYRPGDSIPVVLEGGTFGIVPVNDLLP